MKNDQQIFKFPSILHLRSVVTTQRECFIYLTIDQFPDMIQARCCTVEHAHTLSHVPNLSRVLVSLRFSRLAQAIQLSFVSRCQSYSLAVALLTPLWPANWKSAVSLKSDARRTKWVACRQYGEEWASSCRCLYVCMKAPF